MPILSNSLTLNLTRGKNVDEDKNFDKTGSKSCKMLHLLTKDSQLGTTATKSPTTKVSTATMTTPNTAISSIATTTIRTAKEKGRCI